eukprot:215769-Prymnesium_polylepis.3
MSCELMLERGPCAGQPRMPTGVWTSIGRASHPFGGCSDRLRAWRKTCGAHAVLAVRQPRDVRQKPPDTAHSTRALALPPRPPQPRPTQPRLAGDSSPSTALLRVWDA